MTACSRLSTLTPDEAVGQPDPLGDADAGIEEGHEHAAELRPQDVVEELQGVVVDHRVGGLQSEVGAVQIVARVEQAQQAEDSLQLVLHRLARGARIASSPGRLSPSAPRIW